MYGNDSQMGYLDFVYVCVVYVCVCETGGGGVEGCRRGPCQFLFYIFLLFCNKAL